MVRSTDRPAMTIAVDLGRKATKQTKTNHLTSNFFVLCTNMKVYLIIHSGWSLAEIVMKGRVILQ